MATFNVTVSRLMPQYATFSVEAETEEQAREIALETCGNHEFSSGDAYDDSVDSCDQED